MSCASHVPCMCLAGLGEGRGEPTKSVAGEACAVVLVTIVTHRVMFMEGLLICVKC